MVASAPALVSILAQPQLRLLFRQYPGMEYCDLKRDKATGKSKVGEQAWMVVMPMCAVYNGAFGTCREFVCACELKNCRSFTW
jgi:hypothetical protein